MIVRITATTTPLPTTLTTVTTSSTIRRHGRRRQQHVVDDLSRRLTGFRDNSFGSSAAARFTTTTNKWTPTSSPTTIRTHFLRYRNQQERQFQNYTTITNRFDSGNFLTTKSVAVVPPTAASPSRRPTASKSRRLCPPPPPRQQRREKSTTVAATTHPNTSTSAATTTPHPSTSTSTLQQQNRPKSWWSSLLSSLPSSSFSSSSSSSSWIGRINQFLNQPRVVPIPRWISPQRHTFALSECFGHASFVLVAISYAVSDFIELRLLAIAGSSAMLVFTYFHPHGRILWLPFKWNFLFIALNSWRVAMVYLERYWSEQLSEELNRIYEHHFYVLEKTDFARLVRIGTIEHFQKGQVLVAQGQDNRYVRLVLKGDLIMDRDGQITYTIHEGNFISEVGLHAGLLLRGSVEGCGTVTADSDDVVVLTWDRTELMRLLEFNKSIERSLKAVMSWDIVSKLKSQRTLLARGRVKDPELWTEKRREQTSHRYKSILSNMLSHPQYLNKRKDELAKYRTIHHIERSEHIQALKEMGWTEQEFEEGTKEGQVDADKLEVKKQGMIWWMQSWWNAL